MNYGVVKLDSTNGTGSGSSITVESETDSNNYTQNNGVGIFAVNGSKITIGDTYNKGDLTKNAKIIVHGDNTVGIYAQSFTEKKLDKDGNLLNKFGKTGKDTDGNIVSSITNNGDIVLTGNGAVGIYADNNNGKEEVDKEIKLDSYNTAEKINVSNTGTITVGGILTTGTGETEKQTSSIGIYGINVNVSNTGTITAGSNKGVKANAEGTQTGAVGIYAEKSTVSNIGNIKLGDYTTGVYVDKDSNITNTADVTFDSLAGNTTTRVGIVLDGGDTTAENRKTDLLDFNIDMSGVIGGKAVVAENRSVTFGSTNSRKELKISGNMGRGLRVSDGTATNNGTITLDSTLNNDTNGNAPTSKTGSIGVLAIDQNGEIYNNGKINVNSNYGVGIYIDNQRELNKDTKETASGNEVKAIGNINLNSEHATGVVIKGTGQIDVDGNTFAANGITFGTNAEKSVGVYADGAGAKINITENAGVSVTLDDNGKNVLLYAENEAVVNNDGNITIIGTGETGSGSVGVYLGAGGKYQGSGTLTAENGAIGLYADTSKGTTLDSVNVTVDSKGVNTIGIVMAGDTQNNGTAEINNGTITLTNTNSDKKNQSTGIYIENTALTLNNLTVNHGEKQADNTFTDGSNGTAIYVGSGASITEGTLTLEGQGLEVTDNGVTTTPRSVGIYYTKDAAAGTDGVINNKVTVNINKSNTIGVRSEKSILQSENINIGTEAVGVDNVIGISANNTGNKITLGLAAGKNITINSGSKNIGMVGINADITNSGEITIGAGSTSGTGVLVGTGSTFTNSGTININEKAGKDHLGIGVYLADSSTLTGAGTIRLTEGNAAVYASGNVAVKSDVNIKDSTGAIGLIAGKGASVNGLKDNNEKSVITIDAKATGVYSLGGTTIENIKVISDDKADNTDGKLTMGMYLASSKTEDLEHNVKNSEISLKEGMGIVVASSENGDNTLNLEGTTVTIESETEGNDSSEKGIGIYLGTNGKLVSEGGNTLNISNGIGVYGKEGSKIEIGITEDKKDTITLEGYSLGVYTDKGSITIGKDTTVSADGGEGSLAYGINSNITNNADITVADSKNFMGLFTKYDKTATDAKTLENNGNITISGDRSYGIVAINGTWDETGNSQGDENGLANTIINKGNITISGAVPVTGQISPLSAGIYTEGSSIINSGIISAGDSTVGVAYKNLSSNGVIHNVKLAETDGDKTGQIILTGRRGIGVSLEGAAGTVSIGNITVDNSDPDKNTSGNLGLYLKDFSATDNTIKVGRIALGDSSLGIYAKDTAEINVGDVVIEAKNDSIGVAADTTANSTKTSHIVLGENSTITVGDRGTGLYAGKNSIIELDNFGGITVGKDGVIAHADGGTINMTNMTKTEVELDGHIGFIVADGGKITGNTTLKKMTVSNGGVGMIIRGEVERAGIIDNDTTIILGQNDGSNIDEDGNPKYSVGLYYQNATKLPDDFKGVNVEFGQDSNKAVGITFDRTYGTITYSNGINVNAGTDNIGIIVRRDEVDKTTDENTNGKFILNSNITVSGEGNIGLAGKNSIIDMKGNITTTGTGDKDNHYPIGVYLLGETEDLEHKFTQTGNIKVGENSTGIYAKNYNVVVNGANDNIIEVAAGGIGIFAESDDKHTAADKLHSVEVNGNNISVAASTTDTSKTVGIYGKNNNINVELTGTMEVGNDGSIGVYSLGNGNVQFTGDVKLAEGIYGQGSYGIYKTDLGKDGEGAGSKGTITVEKGTKAWEIGNYSYGIIARAGSRDSRFTINNNADMTLGTSAIGIASFGINILTNTGNISVGDASLYPDGTNNPGETNPSVGIYMGNGFGNDTAKGENTGNISVNSDGSTGIYTLGYVDFTNEGTISVSSGGTGILAGAGAHVMNGTETNGTLAKGTINVSGEGSVGIRAEGTATDISGALVYTTVDNYGTINVTNGATGVVINEGAVFNHHKGAVLSIDGTSYGVRGEGTFNNSGIVNIEEGGILQDNTAAEQSAIVVNDKEVVLNKNYHVSNGILNTGLNVKADGMVVDISEGNGLGINAPDISGNVTLDSKFALTGDGINYEVEDFVKSGKVNVDTSRLYKTNIDDNGTLHVAKDSYANVMNNDRFINFYNAMDSRLEEAGSDAQILKEMNFYLNNLGQTNLFDREAQRITSEMQGDIYGTVQSRMRDINKAFDNSFDEMAEAYNPAVHNNKISLIQGYGENENSNYDMIDYDYTITGVQYMQQYQGLNSSNKYGVHFGFAVSQFEFDDFGSSEENVYSLRAGAHNIQKFGNDITLLSKAELGYNRHDIERKVNYGYGSYENDAEFNSYEVSIDNKLSKDLYQNNNTRFGVYIGLNLEYGRFDDISESGDIAIKVKSNDYLSSKAMAGFDGSFTAYLENDWAVELKGDVGYSYDFGENYKENEAKVKGEDKGYYSLLSDVETRGEAGAKIGVTFKKSETMAVTLEGEYTKDFERDENYWKAGLRFTYKFNSDNSLAALKNPMGFLESHFDFDSDALRNDEREAIEKTSELINKKKVKGTLVIEGHADSIGKESYNQKLSEKRAKNIENEFKKNIKKAENIQYDVKGYGETKPAADNNTPEGRTANRRTNVKFIDKR